LVSRAVNGSVTSGTTRLGVLIGWVSVDGSQPAPSSNIQSFDGKLVSFVHSLSVMSDADHGVCWVVWYEEVWVS